MTHRCRTAARGALLAALSTAAGCAGPHARTEPSADRAAATAGAVPSAPVVDRTPRARTFFPSEYDGDLLVDFAAMRRIDLLDVLERVPMFGTFLLDAPRGLGGELDDLETLRVAVVVAPAGEQAPMRWVAEVHGHDLAAELAAPWRPIELGPHRAWIAGDARTRETARFAPRDGVLVIGDAALLAECVAPGAPATGGTPHPDLLPLLATTDSVVARLAFACRERPVWDHLGSIGFPSGWIDPADPIEAMAASLVERDGELTAKVVLRFSSGAGGAARVRDGVRAALGDLAAARDLPRTQRFFEALRIAPARRAIEIALPLGTARETIANVERIVLEIAASQQAARRARR